MTSNVLKDKNVASYGLQGKKLKRLQVAGYGLRVKGPKSRIMKY